MKIKLLNEFAKMPTRGSPRAAGADLYSTEKVKLLPSIRVVVATGICLELPDTHWAQIAPRSGLAVQHGIMTMAGIIDSDYRGEIKVVLYNSSSVPFEIKIGDRIAQLLIHQMCDFDFELARELSETARADGGFGSTGIK